MQTRWTIGILTNEVHAYGAHVLSQAARSRHCEVVIGPFEVFDDPALLQSIDILIVRLSHESYQKAAQLIQSFTKMNPTGVVNVSAQGAIASFDKFVAFKKMEAASLPTPKTWYVDQSTSISDETLRTIGPSVVKPLDENAGTGVAITPTLLLARQHITKLVATYGACIVQPFIAEAKGSDRRLFVVGDKVVAAMERRAPQGEAIANLARGATARPIQPHAQEVALAVAAARQFEAHFAGVDIISSKHGPLVLEVNASPGFKLATITGTDIATLVIDHLIQTHKDSHD